MSFMTNQIIRKNKKIESIYGYLINYDNFNNLNGTEIWRGRDNAVVDAIKLNLLNYSNFSIAKIVVKEIERVKLTLSRLPTNTELYFNKLVLIKSIQKS